MKKSIKLSMLAVLSFVFTQSFSQVRPSLSIGAELGVPTGDLNVTQKIGVGGSAKIAFPVGAGTALTLSGGYVSFSGDEYQVGNAIIKRPALNFIPIKAGVRYNVVPNGIYLEPQLGFTSISTQNQEGSSGWFTYAANAGYIINNQIDIAARYEAVNKNNTTLPFIGFRVAYNFGL
ncbi:MAG: hypothetical protein JWQ96_2037 [Segetibacter sp.]|nr:hypothetical protein [Segetibacter sp.]